MTDYTELVKALRIRSGNLCPGDICDRCEAIHFLCSDKVMHDAAAAIEALQAEVKRVEPKRAKWIETECAGIEEIVCSNCRCSGWKHLNYCPRCGAKMEAQDGENES